MSTVALPLGVNLSVPSLGTLPGLGSLPSIGSLPGLGLLGGGSGGGMIPPLSFTGGAAGPATSGDATASSSGITFGGINTGTQGFPSWTIGLAIAVAALVLLRK